jgi:cysteine synthase
MNTISERVSVDGALGSIEQRIYLPLAACVDIRRPTPLETVKIGGWRIDLKLESSHKIRAVRVLVARLWRDGVIRAANMPEVELVISSSFNAANETAFCTAGTNARLVVFTDILTPPEARAELATWRHVKVVVINAPDHTGSHSTARNQAVEKYLINHPCAVSIDQYKNSDFPCGYFSIFEEVEGQLGLDQLAAIFLPVGTGALLRAATKYKLRFQRSWQIHAVDAAGSGINGVPQGVRNFSGFGNSGPTEWTKQALPHVNSWFPVPDRGTVWASRWLRAHGFHRGASTCAGFAAAAKAAISGALPHEGRTIVVSPDAGRFYASTLYNDKWLIERNLL